MVHEIVFPRQICRPTGLRSPKSLNAVFLVPTTTNYIYSHARVPGKRTDAACPRLVMHEERASPGKQRGPTGGWINPAVSAT